MSETEHWFGTLVPEEMHGDVEDSCKWILNLHGFNELGNCHSNWTDMFCDQYYREYTIFNNQIYRIFKVERDPNDDIAVASRNEDGTIKFEVKWYNGGGSFNEILDSALENIK